MRKILVAGVVISSTCVGTAKYQKVSNGYGGYSTVLVEDNSPACGAQVKP